MIHPRERSMNGSVQTAKDMEAERVSEVWRKIFTPKIGDWVEFRYQLDNKYILVHGEIIGIGTEYYSVRICDTDRWMYASKWGTWSRIGEMVSVKKGNKKLRVMMEEEVIDKGYKNKVGGRLNTIK